MKKIYITKTDSPTVVVHKILSCPDDDIVLYVPKNSLLTADAKNFKLVRREVSAVGKKVTVESVDSDALELASACGFGIADALFKRSKVPLMDIMPVRRNSDDGGVIRHNFGGPVSHGLEEIEMAQRDMKSNQSKLDVIFGKKKDHSFMEEEVLVPGRAGDEECGEAPEACGKTEYEIPCEDAGGDWRPAKRHTLRKFFITVTALAVLGGLGYLGLFILPKADIKMVMKKTDWNFAGNVSASSGVGSVMVDNSAIPGEIFKISKNGVYSFPASGVKMVENKATGKITIYNAYSSDAQPLVKNTRFVTPEGKIFRTVASITVPGAKITEGKIIPSSVETAIVADAAGDGYNVGSVSKLRIPGFQGTPKYDGFYGELKEGAKGGVIGELKVPTDEDIKKAEAASRRNVEDVLRSQIAASIPAGFKILDQGSDIQTIKSAVTSEPNDKGEFSYGVMLEAKVFAFKESDLLDLMQAKFAKEHTDSFDIRNYAFTYGSPVIDFSAGRMILPLEFKSDWARSFNAEEFKGKISGKSGPELKALIFSVAGVESGRADLWPLWVRSVPTDPSKVTVSAD